MKLELALFAALGAVALPLAAAAQAPATEKAPPSGVVAMAEVQATATVEGIDLAKRLLTIKVPSGRVETFEVDAAVENLDQVKKGDVISLGYHESLLYEVRKAGAATPGLDATAGAATAEPGEKPAIVAARQVSATVTISKIDAAAPSVTFKGPAGNERTVRVQDPKRLEGVKVGDTVDIVYTEALVVKVEKAPARN